MTRKLLAIGRKIISETRLTAMARSERERDLARPFESDPGIDRAVQAALQWLARAQDRSATADGGVSHSYSLLSGWNASYPETTGYVVPTLLDCSVRFGDAALADRARRMLDWLVSIQFPEGGFQGGLVNATPRVPVTFNTGQILLGLAAGVRWFGDRYREPMRRAANWLATTQDADGCWRRHRSPFARPDDKAYETHVSWGLYEAARVEPNAAWVDAANAQVRWAIAKQRGNGWFAENCLTSPTQPLTHTIGYVLRGVVEAYRYTNDEAFLDSALRCARGAQSALGRDGRLPGRLDHRWRGTADWVCLTGSVQIAHCWLLLHQITGDASFAKSAYRANAFVRRTMRAEGPDGVVGGVKGSLPCHGEYLQWRLPNWAAKFAIDANVLEADVRAATSQQRATEIAAAERLLREPSLAEAAPIRAA